MPAIAMMLSGGSSGAPSGTGGHYWRVLVSGGAGDVGLTALLFKDGTGAAITPSGGSAVESNHFGAFDSSKLFDSVDATFWEATGSNNGTWAGYNFSTAKEVRQIALQKTTSMDGSTAPTEVLVQYSENGVAYATVARIPSISLTNDVPTWYDFTSLAQTYPRTSFGSHAYWRMQGQTSNGSWIALSAMLFKDETGSTIATTGGTALESGHTSTFSSANLFDSTDSTFWESDGVGANAWAGYHFTSAVKVMQIGLQKRSAMDGANPPIAVSFEFSDDGVVWGIGPFVIVGTLTNDVPTYFDFAGTL